MCYCEGLRDNRRADIIQLEKKNTSWESKSIHCAMKPIRIQLECPYNSIKETKITHKFLFYLFILFIAQAMFFSEYQHICALVALVALV